MIPISTLTITKSDAKSLEVQYLITALANLTNDNPAALVEATNEDEKNRIHKALYNSNFFFTSLLTPQTITYLKKFLLPGEK